MVQVRIILRNCRVIAVRRVEYMFLKRSTKSHIVGYTDKSQCHSSNLENVCQKRLFNAY